MKDHFRKIYGLLAINSGSVKGFLNLSLLRISQLLFGLAGTHFLAHSLNVSQYGEYQFVLNVVGFLTIFTLTEATNTLMQSVARGHEGSFRKILPYPFLFSLIGSVVLLVFAFWYGIRNNNDHLLYAFLATALFFPFMHGLTIWRGYRMGQQKFSAFTNVEIFSVFLIQAGTIAGALLFEKSYIEILLWFVAVTAGTNIIMTYRILRKVNPEIGYEEGVVLYTIKSSFYTSFSIASNYVDKLLLMFFLDPVALAIYVAAERIPELLRNPVQDVASTLAPRLATKDFYTKKLDRLFKGICIAFGIGAMIFAYTILSPAILAIYGEKYAEAVQYSQFLMIGVVLGNLGSLQIRYIRSKLHTTHLRNIMISTSVIRALISLLLIPTFGIAGAVLSSCLYKAALSLIINRVVIKNYTQ